MKIFLLNHKKRFLQCLLVGDTGIPHPAGSKANSLQLHSGFTWANPHHKLFRKGNPSDGHLFKKMSHAFGKKKALVLLPFPGTVIKYSNKSNWKEEGFTVAHSSVLPSIMGKSERQGLAASHILFTVREQSDEGVKLLSSLSALEQSRVLSREQYHPQWAHFPPHWRPSGVCQVDL